MPKFELYGTAGCPYTREMREWLEMRDADFVEFDVEADPEALRRMRSLTQPPFAVPLLVEDGKVIQSGWQGRSCIVNARLT